MNRLTLGTLIALTAAQVAGCGSSNGDSARISATWELRTVANPTPLSCPPGFDTAALYSQEVDANGANFGSPVIDLFNCDDNAGVSAPLVPTTYVSWIEITTGNNSSLYAQSVAAYVDVTHENKTFDAAIYDDGGYFQIDWSLEDAAPPHAALQCSQVSGLDHISVLSTLASTTTAFDDKYECEDHTGVTAPLPEGTYTVVVDAVNSANQALGESARIDGAHIAGPNKVTTLPAVTLSIDAP